MSVSIRLRREGAKNRPYYKVVVADSRSPRDGKFIEIIGTYDPKVNGANSTIKLDRAEHWMSRGAQPSDTVRSLLKKNKASAAAAPETESAPNEKPVETKPARKKAQPAAESTPAVEAQAPVEAPAPVEEPAPDAAQPAENPPAE